MSKRRPVMLECCRGPWDGLRIPFQGIEVVIPIIEPADMLTGRVKVPSDAVIRTGRYRLSRRLSLDLSDDCLSEASYPIYRWEGED